MEESEYFVRAVTIAEELNQKLKKCDDIALSLQHACEGVKEEIEQHFDWCLVVLAARKAVLIQEVEDEIENQRKEVERTRGAINKSIEGCQELLRSGSSLFNTNKAIAENVWKASIELPNPSLRSRPVRVILPEALIQFMRNHGTVYTDELSFEDASSPSGNATDSKKQACKTEQPASPPASASKHIRPLSSVSKNEGDILMTCRGTKEDELPDSHKDQKGEGSVTGGTFSLFDLILGAIPSMNSNTRVDGQTHATREKLIGGAKEVAEKRVIQLLQETFDEF